MRSFLVVVTVFMMTFTGCTFHENLKDVATNIQGKYKATIEKANGIWLIRNVRTD